MRAATHSPRCGRRRERNACIARPNRPGTAESCAGQRQVATRGSRRLRGPEQRQAAPSAAVGRARPKRAQSAHRGATRQVPVCRTENSTTAASAIAATTPGVFFGPDNPRAVGFRAIGGGRRSTPRPKFYLCPRRAGGRSLGPTSGQPPAARPAGFRDGGESSEAENTSTHYPRHGDHDAGVSWRMTQDATRPTCSSGETDHTTVILTLSAAE